jgi:hypothetical protein
MKPGLVRRESVKRSEARSSSRRPRVILVAREDQWRGERFEGGGGGEPGLIVRNWPGAVQANLSPLGLDRDVGFFVTAAS